MSGAESRALGRWGEALAADWLEKRGCVLAAANWRCRFGEIDLIAEDGDFLCFVEVKLRKSGVYGGAGEAVDRKRLLSSRRSWPFSGESLDLERGNWHNITLVNKLAGPGRFQRKHKMGMI